MNGWHLGQKGLSSVFGGKRSAIPFKIFVKIWVQYLLCVFSELQLVCAHYVVDWSCFFLLRSKTVHAQVVLVQLRVGRLMSHVSMGLAYFEFRFASRLVVWFLRNISERVIVSYKFALVLLELVKLSHTKPFIFVSYILVGLVYASKVTNVFAPVRCVLMRILS